MTRQAWGSRSRSLRRKVGSNWLIGFRFADKVPEWHSKWETEGKTADEVKQLIDRKKIKYVESWGNKSRLGACITDKLDKLYKLEAEQTQKKNKMRLNRC